MDFSKVVGNKHIQTHLKKTVEDGRISHAQLFVGKNGYGLLPMALAYASEILCSAVVGAKAKDECRKRVSSLNHPDLHFIYPVNTNNEVKKNAVSDNFAEQWRQFVLANPYATLFEWLQSLGIEKKQGNISKFEAEQISKKLSLKSYEGGYKVMIIWMAEYMNAECSNKILKLIEEPPTKTVLLLLTENEGRILTTIHSRCQKLSFPSIAEADIVKGLERLEEMDNSTAHRIASRARGDFNIAIQLANDSNTDLEFEVWFIDWVRTAFRAKGNKKTINELLNWSDKLSTENRETQKKFLSFCVEIFRQGVLSNYKAQHLVYFEPRDPLFTIAKFAPFVHSGNIIEIISSLEEAHYHLERNANPKITFTDLSIRLTRLIHSKETV